MKARLCTLLLAAAFLLSAQQSNATIRRVGYWGTPRTNVDYADLQSAHDAAAAGDTLLIFPGNWSAYYSKKLTTIGYGYFIDTASMGTQANAGLQNIKAALYYATLQLSGFTGKVTIKLTDMAGKILWQKGNVDAAQLQIPVSKFSNGSYLVTITGGKETRTLKLIKN